MKYKVALIISILALISPICSAVIMPFFEPEIAEAILGGLLVGCVIGSVLGIASLVISKCKSRLINAFSIIPMCPLALYLLLFIPRLFYI